MSELTDVIDCLIELAAHLQTSLQEQEARSSGISMGPEPSDDVGDVIERLGRIKGSLRYSRPVILSTDGEHEDTYM